MVNPIRTEDSNFVYKGPTADIGDAWTEVVGRGPAGPVYMVWEPDQAERDAIARGANLRLGVCQRPIPPVSLGVTDEQAVEAPTWKDTRAGAQPTWRSEQAASEAVSPEANEG